MGPLRHLTYIWQPTNLTAFQGRNWSLQPAEENWGVKSSVTCQVQTVRPSLDRDPPPGTPEHAKRNPGPPQGDCHQQAPVFLAEAPVFCIRTSVALRGPSWEQARRCRCYRSTALSRAESPNGEREEQTRACTQAGRWMCAYKNKDGGTVKKKKKRK